MASRSIYAGDTYPVIKLQLSDETGVLDLTPAQSTLVIFDGAEFVFSGYGAAINPPEADPDGIHHWNLQYVLTTGNTANPDVYKIFAKVTWSALNIETFATGDTLTITPAPPTS